MPIVNSMQYIIVICLTIFAFWGLKNKFLSQNCPILVLNIRNSDLPLRDAVIDEMMGFVNRGQLL